MRFSRAFALLLLVLALLSVTTLAQEAASVTLQPVAFVPVEGETFTTDVTIENSKDLLGFQFDINFDPAVLAVESIELGPFLSSTGRSAQPLGPDLRSAGEGRVVYGGFTLGTQEQPGAEGAGVLATITWRVIQATDFAATLSRVQLAGPGGQALPGSDTSPPPPAEPAEQAVQQQPTATPQPAPIEEEPNSPDYSAYAVPVAIIVVILAVALFALWRITHRPGGNRDSDNK